MRTIRSAFLILSCLLLCSACCLNAAVVSNPSMTGTIPSPKAVAKGFEPFTGKITKNKVRMRLQSTYDGQVLRELKSNDLVVVLGETDDFYAVQPPSDIRGYVFRTFVLDNIIEGNRVNVRLKPDLDSPVIAQLNTGDRVDGTVNPDSNKWLEIKLPETARFYIAKEYIEKAGDAGLMARLEKKQEAANRLLATTDALSKSEMQKPFNQMNIDGIKASYLALIRDYPEFPDAGDKAKESLAALQEAYTAKKLAYLESQTQNSSVSLETAKKLAAEVQAHKSKIASLEQQLETTHQILGTPQTVASVQQQPMRRPMQLPINMAFWLPIEESLYSSWAMEKGGNKSPTEFYDDQKQQAFVLKGIIELYNRPVKNKPGDYMIINSASKLPVAFLYSTQVNLHDYIGHEVSVLVSSRPNNDFAFPAYFVLSIQ